MPSWHGIGQQIQEQIEKGNRAIDTVRKEYLSLLSKHTQRNTIIYYSGWLQKPNVDGLIISDVDKNGFMSVIHNLDRSRGLDLLIHTPGGDTAATESIVDYIRRMFDDVRVIVPQIAMSGGTMIACAANSIVMGKQSNLGPIDPQFQGIPAHGVIEEFEEAKKAIKKDQKEIPVWQPVIAKYPPTFIGECRKALNWSKEMTKDWLVTGMFKDEEDKENKAKEIVDFLCDHQSTFTHNRHLSISKCKEIGLKITDLESDQDLQELVLSVHHACMHTLAQTSSIKLIENQDGIAFIQHASPVRE